MKILSIDFNYIMYPCIKLYSRYCNEEENPTVNWNNIQNELEIDNFLCYDGEILKQLAALIRRNQRNGVPLYPITHHKEAVDGIKKLTDESIELTNIDWHHDIAAAPNDVDKLQNFGEYGDMDWVGYLQTQGKLSKYTWIRARNSEPCHPDISDKLNLSYEEGTARNIPELPDDYDAIFFCLSPNQVPHKYKHLYELIGGI